MLGSNGQQLYFNAKREVIISSGAYGSPPVLLRSGIGPRVELEQLGIHTNVDLLGVGKNLMDHLVRTGLL